ncbi:MAG TPA: hypothetical protein GXZ30_06985 [Propionibacterium sp.]|jgi:acetyltransferase-like isoleucine patch superfamily enzyme|nr:hypothetical protein [Propionibacterium sp.]
MSLIEKVVRAAGRDYTPDPTLPRAFILGEYARRSAQLARGALTWRSISFRGASVQVRFPSGLRMGRLAAIGEGSIVDASGTRGVVLGRGAKLGRRVIVTTTSQLSKRGVGLQLGDFTGIGDYAHIGCSGGVTFGDNVIVGPYLTCHSQEHVTRDTEELIRLQGTEESEIVVGDNVWIGARVTLLAGSHVGNGSIIAAGSVVRGDFPPMSVIGGIPARLIKSRKAVS